MFRNKKLPVGFNLIMIFSFKHCYTIIGITVKIHFPLKNKMSNNLQTKTKIFTEIKYNLIPFPLQPQIYQVRYAIYPITLKCQVFHFSI